MTIDIERLKHDLGYWNSVAPEGATHYGERGGSLMPGWYKPSLDKQGAYLFASESSHYWKRAEAFERRALIPRPSPTWNGEGLPPVGNVVAYKSSGPHADRYPISQWRDGDKLEVVAHKTVDGELIPIVFNLRGRTASGLMVQYCRPLKTEKERVVEAAMEYAPWPGDSTTENTLKALYDAGMLKEPTND